MTWGQLVSEIGGKVLRLDRPEKKIADKAMTRADEFRAKAEGCEQRAERVKDVEAGRLLMKAAQNYRDLAALAERRRW